MLLPSHTSFSLAHRGGLNMSSTFALYGEHAEVDDGFLLRFIWPPLELRYPIYHPCMHVHRLWRSLTDLKITNVSGEDWCFGHFFDNCSSTKSNSIDCITVVAWRFASSGHRNLQGLGDEFSHSFLCHQRLSTYDPFQCQLGRVLGVGGERIHAHKLRYGCDHI